MARKKAKRKGGRARRRTSSAHFVLKTEALCKCPTPRGTLGVLKRRLAAACKRDPHSYIVNTKATGAVRTVARCGGAS
jgi:hypothetical protein